MYKLLIKADTISEAKILGKCVRHYLVGQNFKVVYRLENAGDQVFTGGNFTVAIRWPNGQFEVTSYAIPSLKPREAKQAEPASTWGVLCRGFALFFLIDARDKEGKAIILYKTPNDPVSGQASFHSVLGIESEEIYQLWAMIAAVVSLLVLVSEKIVQLILTLMQSK